MEDTNRGSLTIEAAIVLPMFIFVILSIMSLMKLVIAHEIIQHSISESANQLAGYSYVLNATGLKEKYDGVMDDVISGKGPFDEIINNVENLKTEAENLDESIKKTSEAFQKITGKASFSVDYVQNNINNAKDVIDGLQDSSDSINNGTEELKDLADNVEGVIKNPESLIALIGYELIEKGKSFGLGFYTEKMLKYIFLDYEPGNDPLEKLGVVGGINGLEFNNSKLFSVENNGSKEYEDIDIVVNYKFNPKMPIPAITEIDVVQRAVVRAWMDGGE